jgi:hypothetical protein
LLARREEVRKWRAASASHGIESMRRCAELHYPARRASLVYAPGVFGQGEIIRCAQG